MSEPNLDLFPNEGQPPRGGLRKPSSTILKLVVIGLIILLMNIPLLMVQGVIEERQSSNEQVMGEISSTWAGTQLITGPVLVVPYRKTEQDGKGKPYTVDGLAYFLPEHLNVKGTIQPEVRERGIYKTVVYTTALEVTGDFGALKNEGGVSPQDYRWKEAYLSVGLTDNRGIRQETGLQWGREKLQFKPGTNGLSIAGSGIHADLPTLKEADKYPFAFTLNLNGSSSLQFAPLGKHSKVRLTSPWPSPSFTGGFLPTRRTVSEKGFDATWDVSYFARCFPQSWTTMNQDPNLGNAILQSQIGVSLISPVDFYRNAVRSVKYGVLFIALSFLTFFLFEVLLRSRIHVVQYLMVGFALCLFYLLLISLSEMLGFLTAYVLASIPTISLISFYTYSITRECKGQMAAIMSAVLALLYTYLYILLQLEEYSLVFGSIGLFLALATVMVLTRNIDWYNEK